MAGDTRAAYVVCGSACGALFFVFAFQGYYPDLIGPFSDVITPIIAGGAALVAVVAGRLYGFTEKAPFSRVWLLFSIGMIAWFLAELTWFLYVHLLNVEVPYPSFADVFYLAGYVFFFVGLGMYIRLFAPGLKKWAVIATVLATAVMLLLIFAYLQEPIVASSEDGLSKTLDVLYPFLDVGLLSLALLGFALFFGGTLGRAWLILNLAIALDAVADVIYGYQNAQGITYYSGSASDVVYLWSYALFGLAFYVHTREL